MHGHREPDHAERLAAMVVTHMVDEIAEKVHYRKGLNHVNELGEVTNIQSWQAMPRDLQWKFRQLAQAALESRPDAPPCKDMGSHLADEMRAGANRYAQAQGWPARDWTLGLLARVDGEGEVSAKDASAFLDLDAAHRRGLLTCVRKSDEETVYRLSNYGQSVLWKFWEEAHSGEKPMPKDEARINEKLTSLDEETLRKLLRVKERGEVNEEDEDLEQ